MIGALRGEDLATKIQALLTLEAGEAPIDEAICRALIELGADPRKEVGRRAAGALARVAADAPFRALVEAALTDADARRRWCAAFALSRAGVHVAAVVSAAIDALAASDGDVRWAAAEIVCRAAREQPDVVQELARATASAVPERRKMALYCLRDLAKGTPAAFAVALQDPDRGVRLAGLAGLARCSRLAADEREKLLACVRTDEDDGVRRAAVATAARIAASDPETAAALARVTSESGQQEKAP